MKKAHHTLFGSEIINEKNISFQCCLDKTRDPRVLFSAGSMVQVQVAKKKKNSRESYHVPLIRILHDTSNSGYYALVPNQHHDKLVKPYLNLIQPSNSPPTAIDVGRLYQEWKIKSALPHTTPRMRVKAEGEPEPPQTQGRSLRPVNQQINYTDKQIIIPSDIKKLNAQSDSDYYESEEIEESDEYSREEARPKESTTKKRKKKIVEKKRPLKKSSGKNNLVGKKKKNSAFFVEEEKEEDREDEEEKEEEDEAKEKTNHIISKPSKKRNSSFISDSDFEYRLNVLRELEAEEDQRIERVKLNNVQAHFHEDWHQRKLRLFDEWNQGPSHT